MVTLPQAFPLFKGCTRVPTIMGVPMLPFMGMVMVVSILAMLISIWCWLLGLPLWFTMAQVTKNDDKAFRIWALWADTKLRNGRQTFWGASTYSPTPYCKRR
jgi:type IV secretion system protein VirB3